MRRGLIALLPLVGLSGAFIVNQSCATKSALEEVQGEAEVPKKNIQEARENLQEARGILGEARRILESARERLERHIANRELHTPPPPPEKPVAEEVPPAPVEKEEYGTVKVGWCDTLWDISERVYNNSLYWPAIYNLNREKVGDDPWILAQGTVLRYKLNLTEEEKDMAVRRL
ncbi:MAG: hypothetical protein Q9N34_01850 [Aquificota bacterium]|nr:hypothetical protein [Aquificota bacterium]